MGYVMKRLSLAVAIPLLAIHAVLPTPGHARPGPYEIDVKELDRPAPPPASRKAEKAKTPHRKQSATKALSREQIHKSGYLTYTVRPGDYLFKILITKFGMSDEQAESLIPEIIRINRISDIRDLEVGSKLLIPRQVQAHPSPPVKKRTARGASKKTEAEAAAIQEKGSRLEAQGMAPGGGTAPAAPAPAEASPAAEAPKASAAPLSPPATLVPLAPLSPTVPAAGAVPSAATWLCQVANHDPGRTVESILSALSIPWCRNRIIHSDHSASISFSIRVDRYFERKGGRYIVSIGDGDAYTHALLRLLESTGYRIISIGAQDDFKSVAEKLLTGIGVVPDYGVHELPGGKSITGFLVRQEEAGGRRVVISKDAVKGDQKWVMAPGCGSK